MPNDLKCEFKEKENYMTNDWKLGFSTSGEEADNKVMVLNFV